MATDPSFADHIFDLASSIPGVRVAKLFGEYALYIGGKTVAVICDNQVFVKVTEPGRRLCPDAALAPPYPGAKAALVADILDDRDAFVELLRATEAALPTPTPKKPKVSRS